MDGALYESKDVRKAYRTEDGAEVEVPKRWLESGSPFKDGYTTTDPSKGSEEAAKAANESLAKAREAKAAKDAEAKAAKDAEAKG